MGSDLGHLDAFCLFLCQPSLLATTTFPRSAVILANSNLAIIFGLGLVLLYADHSLANQKISTG